MPSGLSQKTRLAGLHRLWAAWKVYILRQQKSRQAREAAVLFWAVKTTDRLFQAFR